MADELSDSPSSSAASTPLDTPTHDEAFHPDDVPKRLPSLRSVSDNPAHPMTPSSTSLGVLSAARRPAPLAAGGAGNRLPEDLTAKMRAFHLSRQGGTPAPPSPAPAAGSPSPSAFPGGLKPPGQGGMKRPNAPSFAHSAPSVPHVAPPGGGMAARRKPFGFKLSDMSGGSAATEPPSGDTAAAGGPQTQSHTDMGAPSKMKEFADYIDSEKGYLTFKGKAIITNKGVDFSDGSVFRINLDEIEKLDELGKGNYGVVYKVRHNKPTMPRFGPGLQGFKSSSLTGLANPKLSVEELESQPARGDTSGKVMAMKEIRLELDEAKFGTILKELIILHECVSPYIIDFYGAFFQESAVYMCIEYMDGGSIDKLYAGGIPESILRKITYCTIMGLKELKDKHNIIHRDVKPTNILVNTQGQVKICDFGVSGNLVASIAKTNIGCQSYMAPERISGGAFMTSGASDGTYSVQSDIWSLGLTIIECAMGKYPYPPEVSSTIFSQLSAIVEGDPPDLPPKGYSDSVRQFVHGCLNKVPRLRPNYQALLASDWLQRMTKPETITEEDEEDAESGSAIADAANKVDLSHSSTEDAEIASWVQTVLKEKATGFYDDKIKRPALHSARFDDVASPMASPAAPRT